MIQMLWKIEEFYEYDENMKNVFDWIKKKKKFDKNDISQLLKKNDLSNSQDDPLYFFMS